MDCIIPRCKGRGGFRLESIEQIIESKGGGGESLK